MRIVVLDLNLYKYIKTFAVINWKLFFIKVTATLTFDLLTSKSIGVIFWSSMMFVSPSVLQLLRGNHFSALGHRDLDWVSRSKVTVTLS